MIISTQTISECINRVKNRFETNPYIYLSENDVVCQLYNELLREFELIQLEKTKSGEKTIALHTEVPFFSREPKHPILNMKVDIVIVKPNEITFDRNEFRLSKYSTKDYRFNEADCCIEVKYNKVGSKNKCLKDIKEDLEKLKTINTEPSFILFLDKKSHFNEEDLDALRSEYEGIKIIYGKPTR